MFSHTSVVRRRVHTATRAKPTEPDAIGSTKPGKAHYTIQTKLGPPHQKLKKLVSHESVQIKILYVSDPQLLGRENKTTLVHCVSLCSEVTMLYRISPKSEKNSPANTYSLRSPG